MDALFDPERHEALAGGAWNAGEARAAIDRIVADTRVAANPAGLWPSHLNDVPEGTPPLSPLYFGAVGVTWGLDYLARSEAVAPGPHFGEHLVATGVRNAAYFKRTGMQTRSLLMGDAGVLLTRWNIERDTALLDELASIIAANTDDPALELMWGAPGTMLVALALHRQTGEARWAELFVAGAEALERDLVFDEAHGAHVWTQTLYGQVGSYYGGVHGFAGNAHVLIAGRELLAPEVWSRWATRLAGTLEALAMREDGAANWPAKDGAPMLVHHCHGAPGMVTCLAQLPEPIDELLLAGGELVWRAGPLLKGANVCHGTGGNGYAFLKLFERTGDQMWLDRARAFAMHAIGQSDADAAQFGQRRYSLWTGDIGFACYLWDCIEGQARFPTLDVL